jgi:hypothetical protein
MQTFFTKYSNWTNDLFPNPTNQYKRIEKLVLSFNSSYKVEVERAKNKYNNRLRSVIREKIGLSLNFQKTNLVLNTSDKDNVSIPIKIVDKVPQNLLRIFEKYKDEQIQLLLHYRDIQDTIHEIKYQIENFKIYEKFHQNMFEIDSLVHTLDYFMKLKIEIDNSGIIGEVQNLGPDTLGSYFIKDNRIELYWLSIGLCSIFYDCSVEDFTLIALTHELLHGYTHIGFDKDGNNWDTNYFQNCDLRIVEGFAQFYTELICTDYFSQSIKAFNNLLTVQSEEYYSYKTWLPENEKDKYEKARQMLLMVRKEKTIKYDDFKTRFKII